MLLDEVVVLALELLRPARNLLLALLQLRAPCLELRLALGGGAAGCMRLLAQDVLALERRLQLRAHGVELGHGAVHDHLDRRRHGGGSRNLRFGRRGRCDVAVLLPFEQGPEPGPEALLGLGRRHEWKILRMLSIAGPRTTMNIAGKMKPTVGNSILIGAFIAFSSAAA